MDVSTVEARLNELRIQADNLKKQQEQIVANAYAVDGAIQDCEYWLEKLKGAETSPSPREEKLNGDLS